MIDVKGTKSLEQIKHDLSQIRHFVDYAANNEITAFDIEEATYMARVMQILDLITLLTNEADYYTDKLIHNRSDYDD